jgi:hypothetical protein
MENSEANSIPSGQEPLDKVLFEIVTEAVASALQNARKEIASGGYIRTHNNFPELGHFANGMPSFGIAWGNERKDYASLFDQHIFSVLNPPEYQLEQDPAFSKLKTYFRSNEEIWSRCLGSRLTEPADADPYLKTEVKVFITQLVDRYIHVHKDAAFSASKLLPIYLPFEARLLLSQLAVSVWVPILFVRFDVEEFELQNGIYIRTIPEPLQLARADEKAYSPATHEVVRGAATHAFVLTGYSIANTEWAEWAQIASSAEAYPTDRIDLLFAMLRLATGANTGYAQLLLEPIGWAGGYKADLPPLEGTAVRKYPAMFEAFHWNEPELPSVNAADLLRMATLYSKLSGVADEHLKNRLILACKRLNTCLLREDEGDSVLDATAALEVLLTPGDTNEITHKLATRLAGLSRLAVGNDPAWTVFRNVKKIYTHRSNVAHGNFMKVERSKQIRIDSSNTVPTVRLATDYLRMALQVLIENPTYLESAQIDEHLLLASPSDSSGHAN